MIAVEVKVSGVKELDEKLGRFRGKKPGLRIAKEVADDMVVNMRSLVPYWHGNLQKSIKVVPHENGYSINMNFYGRFVESGTAPHTVSINNYLFRAWALSKGIPWESLRKGVALRGTLPHPFIEPSVDASLYAFDRRAISVLNKTLKESGFR